MILELTQIVGRQGTLLTDDQMIRGVLKILAGEVAVNVQGRLLDRQVCALRVRRGNFRGLAEDLRPQGEERRVSFQAMFHPPTAFFAHAQVFGHGQQLYDPQLLQAVIFKLSLGQVRDQVSFNPRGRGTAVFCNK